MQKKTGSGLNGAPLSPLAAELTRFTLDLKTRLDMVEAQQQPPSFRYGYRIGSIRFLLNDRQPTEVIPAMTVCEIPNTPGWFRGMINVRGNLLPVFDLQLLLEGAVAEMPWFMIMGRENRQAVLCISTLPDSVKVNDPVESRGKEIPEWLRPHLLAAYNDGQDIWLEPEYDLMFTALRNFF